MKAEFKSPRRVRGQGMTEYVVIVALVAIAAVGVYTSLGKTVRHQTAGVATGLAGEKKKADGELVKAKDAADKAVTDAAAQRGLSNFTEGTGQQ